MAEAREPEAAEEAEPAFDTGAAAIALALDEARAGRGDEVSAFLAAQRSLVELQKHHLHAQFQQLRLRTAGEGIKLALQGLTLAAVLGVVVILGLMVRDASQARGLVVEGFSAPPVFAARGYSGETLAAGLTSRIAAVDGVANANSLTRSEEVRRRGAENVKLEVPETGVSLDEVERYLRRWLGHETSLTADLTDEGGGEAAITLNMAGQAPVVVHGKSADLDGLLQQAAERAFATFDPGNYVLYLEGRGRADDAFAAAEQVQHANADEPRYYSLSANADPDRRRALRKAEIVTAGAPDFMFGWMEVASANEDLGRDEAMLAAARHILTLRAEALPPAERGGAPWVFRGAHRRIHLALGNFDRLDSRTLSPSVDQHYAVKARIAALTHDPAAVEPALAYAAVSGQLPPTDPLETRWLAASTGGDWPRALALAQALVAAEETARAAATPTQAPVQELELATVYRPWLALSQAMTGQVAQAQALIATTPMDCDLCLRTRAMIAAQAGDAAGADRWFAAAVRSAPSIPFAHLAWGEAKLARGDPAGAEAEFTRAHALSPDFADASMALGQALLARGDAAGAAARFQAAALHAPHWGRLHLKWGEALAKQGKADAARAQFRLAAGLDLSAAERAELAAQRS